MKEPRQKKEKKYKIYFIVIFYYNGNIDILHMTNHPQHVADQHNT